MTNRQKLLFMVEELHKRGFGKLLIIPGLSPSGMYWRCSFYDETRNNECGASNWIYNYEKENSEEEIKLTTQELTDLFIKENFEFLENCKGENNEYIKWYSDMLLQLKKDELPYAYADWEMQEDIWETSKGNKIKTLRYLKKQNNNKITQIKSALFGIAVGDALGVPVEFNSRQRIAQNPVTDMIGFGTYHLQAGTWSDDSSLTFCLAEALTQKFDLNTIGQNFVKWYQENFWTPRGNVFDIGIATRQAISRLAQGERPDLAGNFDESSNGNGSLMRILPLLFYIQDKTINERYEITKKVSSITHGHIRSVIACFYYLEFARQIFTGKDKFETYTDLQTEITNYLTSLSINPTEIAMFDRLLKNDIHELHENEIQSSGYVLHTLEASIWCVLTTDNYRDAVLKAVNLGNDTDTTGAVTGGLAGILYGIDSIPTNWIMQIARKDDIENLVERLANRIACL